MEEPEPTVGEVVSGYIADGASRLSPGTLDFYRKGLAALPDAFGNRGVAEVTSMIEGSRFNTAGSRFGTCIAAGPRPSRRRVRRHLRRDIDTIPERWAIARDRAEQVWRRQAARTDVQIRRGFRGRRQRCRPIRRA